MSRFFSQLTNFCTPSRRHRKKLTAAGDHFSPSLPRRSTSSGSGHSQMQRSVSMMTIWEEPAAIVHKSQLRGMERGISEEENEGYETASALSPECKGRKSPRKGRKKNEQEQGGSVRLRRREASIKKEGAEAGFDVSGEQNGIPAGHLREWDGKSPGRVVRCSSTASLPFHHSSQFKPDEVFSVQQHSVGGGSRSVFDAPTAVVGPRTGAGRSPAYHQPCQHELDCECCQSHGQPPSAFAYGLPPTVGVLRGDYPLTDPSKGHRRSLHSASHNVVEHQHLNTSHGHSRYAPATHSHNQQQIGYGSSATNGNTGHQIRSSFYESPHISHSAHVLGRNAAANGNHSNKVAVAPQISGGRRYSGHRDSDQHVHGSPYDRRNSSSQGLDLPAYNSVMSRMTGDERIVDGPSLGTPTSSNSLTVAEQLRVSMLEQKVNELQAQLSQIRPQPQLQQSYGQNSRDLYEMEDELLKTKDQYKQLQQSYRKITKQNDAMQQEYEHTIQQLTNELDRAKLDLEEFQQKQYEMEEKLAMVQEKSSTPGAVDQMKTRELQAKTEQIRQLQIELTNHRTDLAALELMKKDYDKLKGEFEYQKSKLDELQRANDDKDDRIRDLQRTLNAQRLDLQAAACQQSCSSGSTPVADDAESLADVMARSMYAAIPSQTRNSRTVTPRTYTKAHTTLGGMESPTLSNKRSTSGSRNRLPLMPSVLTKSYSNFNLNSTGGGPISEITPQMSQAIRSQEKKLLDSQLLVRSLLGTLQKVANGEQPDISRLLGIKTESMSESETEQVEPDSSPLTITAAEKKLHDQDDRMARLESDLETIRTLMQRLYEERIDDTLTGGDDVCRVQ